MSKEAIVFWPGGGGELEDRAQPNKSYTIVGSWTGFEEPQEMTAVSRGTYAFTVTLGPHCFEIFQIRLDGDEDKVLHPGVRGGQKDMVVRGPEKADKSKDLFWTIDGRKQSYASAPGTLALKDGDSTGMELAILSGGGSQQEDLGKPGDQYKIYLNIMGSYRTVSWEKLMKEGTGDELVPLTAPYEEGKYCIMASWNCWTFEEMTPDESTPGLYHTEVKLKRAGTIFQINRNEDWNQMIYPATPYARGGGAEEVCGPDNLGSVYNWCIDGKAGEVYQIDFQRVYTEGTVKMDVSWRKVRSETPEPPVTTNEYCIVGSWFNEYMRDRMDWDGTAFTYNIEMGINHKESFQILENGDWLRMLYPERPDSGTLDEARVLGPNDRGYANSWIIGKDEVDHAHEGCHFEIRLVVERGQPVSVTWKRTD